MKNLKSRIRRASCVAACLTAFITLPTAGPTHAEVTAPTPSAQTATEASPARPALWKIADEDTTIWLFGTIHILPHEVNWYTGPVAGALDGSEELVTEIALDDMEGSASALMARNQRDDGQTLRAGLPSKLRPAYEEAMATSGIPPQLFDANDTWFAALMLTMLPLAKAGYTNANGIDQQVAEKARARKLANTALETPEFQVDIFENLPEASQQAYLSEVVKALPTMKEDIGAMVDAWTAGDAERLAALMNEAESEPELRRLLLTDRNRTWAQWLRKRLDKPGNVFVAVGAGHLAGPGSVQDELATAGITSHRVQ